jgi:uncharacterized protein YceK
VRFEREEATVSISNWIALGATVSIAGCATIINFDEPFEQATGGAASTSSTTTAQGGSGGSTTSTSSTTTSSACVPDASCASEGVTCGPLFDGCEAIDCGTCDAPFVCSPDTRTCLCTNGVTVHPALVADTAIQNHPSWVCGALQSGDATCLNISQYLSDSRALLRFSIDAATSQALMTPGSVTSARLTLVPAPVCQSTSFTPEGKVQVYVLRSDWDEMQARWCHRKGAQGDATTHPWDKSGANGDGADHGALAAEMDMPTDNLPFEVPLDPAALVSPLVTGTEISLLVLTPVGSKLVIESRENGKPAKLDIEYCPIP